jgi:hypothetical protein
MNDASRAPTWDPSSQCSSSTWHLPISGSANASHDVFFLPRGCQTDAHMYSEGSNTGWGTQLGPWTVPQGRFAVVAQRWEAYPQYAVRSVLFGPKSKVRHTIRTIRYGTLCTKYASHNPVGKPSILPERWGGLPEIPTTLATTTGANRQNGGRKTYQDVGFRQRLATEKEIIALVLATPATSPKA